MSGRIFLCTYNNPTVDPKDYLEKWFTVAKARYVCGQLEKGKEGTVHIQFYLNFAKSQRLAALKKHCKSAHFEIVRRDNGASPYCMKEDTRLDGPWEFGIKPVKRDSAVDWQQVKDHAIAGDLDKIDPSVYVQHYHNLK